MWQTETWKKHHVHALSVVRDVSKLYAEGEGVWGGVAFFHKLQMGDWNSTHISKMGANYFYGTLRGLHFLGNFGHVQGRFWFVLDFLKI